MEVTVQLLHIMASSWELTSGELVYREGDPAYIPHVYYAPNYKWANTWQISFERR